MEVNKFSVVIPTLLQCKNTLNKLLNVLDRSPNVTEIIIILNSKETYCPLSDKVIVINPETNLFVNPSWNIGVSVSREDNIVLLSDDVLIPDSFFPMISNIDFNQCGVVGASDPHIIRSEHDKIDYFDVTGNGSIELSDVRTWGFGTVMVMRKSNYRSIPDELKIWCGDDWLYHKLKMEGKKNGFFFIPIMTKMSTTSDLSEYDDIKQNDLREFEKYKLELGL